MVYLTDGDIYRQVLKGVWASSGWSTFLVKALALKLSGQKR